MVVLCGSWCHRKLSRVGLQLHFHSALSLLHGLSALQVGMTTAISKAQLIQDSSIITVNVSRLLQSRQGLRAIIRSRCRRVGRRKRRRRRSRAIVVISTTILTATIFFSCSRGCLLLWCCSSKRDSGNVCMNTTVTLDPLITASTCHGGRRRMRSTLLLLRFGAKLHRL